MSRKVYVVYVDAGGRDHWLDSIWTTREAADKRAGSKDAKGYYNYSTYVEEEDLDPESEGAAPR